MSEVTPCSSCGLDTENEPFALCDECGESPEKVRDDGTAYSEGYRAGLEAAAKHVGNHVITGGGNRIETGYAKELLALLPPEAVKPCQHPRTTATEKHWECHVCGLSEGRP